jgi:AcrR family transcriptional regulator
MTTRRRRTQLERTTETRARLLDVTLECLAELGYARTTNQEIADRAGLSRGAQLHHFGSKAQLVTAAMEHLADRRNREFQRALAALPAGADTVAAGVDLLWGILSGPTGYAYLELCAAARTDPELREAMLVVVRRMDEQVDRTFRALFAAGPVAGGDDAVVWTALFALLEGLAVENIVRADRAPIEQVLAALKAVAHLAIVPRPPALDPDDTTA